MKYVDCIIVDITNAAAMPETPYHCPNTIIVGVNTDSEIIKLIMINLLFSKAKNLEV